MDNHSGVFGIIARFDIRSSMIKYLFIIATYMPKLSLLLGFVIALLQGSGPQGDDCYPVTGRDLDWANAPRFEQYAVEDLATKWIPADTNSNPQARMYRTALRRGTAEGPNFAGYYSIVAWGCGSSCVQFAIVNRKTGKVFFPEGINDISGVPLNANDFQVKASTGYWGLRFMLNSRLLILVGAINEDEERQGAFYYVIEGDQLKAVFSVPVKKRWCVE